MKGLYSSPLRVYLCLALLAGVGLFSGFRLPISLFPNSTKPKVHMELSFGGSTAEEFFQSYGSQLEDQLRNISTQGIQVEKLSATYNPTGVEYELEFRWGGKSNEALRESQAVVNAFSARFPVEVRDSLSIWTSNRNSGFFALSFFSATRSLDDLHSLLEPVLLPKLARIEDADHPHLYNPNEKEIRLELIPEKMAAFQLFPKDIERGVVSALSSYGGGSVSIGENQISVEVPRSVRGLDEISRILVATHKGRFVHLSDIAKIDFGKKTNADQAFRTNGLESLILFARPKPDGNVKRMSEEMLSAVKMLIPTLPKDVEFRVLVDPSEFIRASVTNVLHEVAIGAGLAVLILFLFIGSFRNTVTAAIEIPLSMVLAFILMKLSGMNLNLISLGGLALSAGMNVDASVVVMENIFRHFEDHRGPLDAGKRLSIVIRAVKEVQFSVIASTIASLVVFLPLAFTSDLSYAILGDLAKTVVFSHGFSAVVALILVPTVRLHLMSREVQAQPLHSPIERLLVGIESIYSRGLTHYLASPRFQNLSFIGLLVLISGLTWLIVPKLPREIIGKPDTDWMVLSVTPRGNTLVKQMESRAEEVESEVIQLLGSDLSYLFTEVNGPNSGEIMARLQDKRKMREVWKKLEAKFVNTPDESYWIGPWNPSELPIPDPPDLKISVRGGTAESRRDYTNALNIYLKEKEVLPRIWAEPEVSHKERIVVRPILALWSHLQEAGGNFSPADLADLLRVATQGRRVATFPIEDRKTDVVMKYPEGFLQDIDQIGAFPVGVGSKLLALKAIAPVQFEVVPPSIFREDGKELFMIKGRRDQSDESGPAMKPTEIESWIQKWRTEQPSFSKDPKITVQVEDSQKELHDALRQLATAVGLSILLIFVTMVIQFGDLASAGLVLVAIPLGLFGVVISLYVFKSTLSLNSVLGVILLNGIAVANSILLVDFLKREVRRGLKPAEAAVEAGRKRLRPILITSLTTILGMLPIAMGFGEGGKILQPLGITVSGGLWVSMLLTLFVVPALQVRYLGWKLKPRANQLMWDLDLAIHDFVPGHPPSSELTQ